MDHDLPALRRHAFGVAYRMLGSVPDAEDVVQEALLRLTRAGAAPDEPAAWITTVTTRLAIDHLRLARTRRETYVGPWLPDPLIADVAPGPGARVELAESVSQAFLVALERLSPLERAAFLLRDVFDYDYSRIAEVLEREEAACRQLVARARRHIEAGRTRFDADRAGLDALLQRFLAAAEDGDLHALEAMLAGDAIALTDGGGRAKAALKPIYGAVKVARFMAGITRIRRRAEPFEERLATVNGHPGRITLRPDGSAIDVLSIDVVDGRIVTVRITRNPDKLAHV